jgi:GTP 3',8-cyclase
MQTQLLSPGNRPITYLRISVTDRCDMRCLYCMPADGAEFMPAESHLTNAEILRTVDVAAGMGIDKVRLTGGEPLLRAGIVDLVRGLAEIPGIREVTLSTNGSHLERHALQLAGAGLKRVNISLDTLDPRVFTMITRGGSLSRTLAGIDSAEAAGLTPIKINTVVMRGLNLEHVPAMVEMGIRRNWQVRFIEYMPLGIADGGVWDEHFVPAGEILALFRDRFPLTEVPMHRGDPARLYRVLGSSATVGVITPVTQHFCDSCNRLRLTADGKVRSCLLAEGATDLRSLLRSGCSDEAIAEVLTAAAGAKPEWHGLAPGEYSRSTHTMNEIGG